MAPDGVEIDQALSIRPYDVQVSRSGPASSTRSSILESNR
jgi:hypothetical protein